MVVLELKKQVHPRRPGLQWTAEIMRNGIRVKCILDDESDEPTAPGPWNCELGKIITGSLVTFTIKSPAVPQTC